MSYNVNGTTISLTRGDSFEATVSITDYTPTTNDTIRFAMKHDYADSNPVIVKDIPISTMTLKLDPADTKSLPFGRYVYDIQLTKGDGEVDTFITKASLQLTEEVC